MAVKLLGVLGLLAASAFCALGETSLLSLSRLQLSRLDRAHPGRLTFWQRDPERALTVLLLFNNVINAGLGVLSVSLALDAAEFLGFPFRWGSVMFPLAGGALMLFLGDILPKVVARSAAEPVALLVAPWVEKLASVFGPVTRGLLVWTGGVLSRLSRTVRTERAQWDQDVIRALLDGAPLGSPLRRVLKNVVSFGQTQVSAVMVPRSEIVSANLAAGGGLVKDRILRSGYSRVPVHRGSLDAAQGMVYAKDLLAQRRSEGLISLQDIIRPLPRVSPDTTLAALLRDFRQGHHHMALVGDRAGRVVGLVTLQDTLEAIIGEVAEEPPAERNPS